MLPTPGSDRRLSVAAIALVCIAVAPQSLRALPLDGDAPPVRSASSGSVIPYIAPSRIVMPAGVDLATMLARRIPTFSRQTKLACSACHYGFPQLTPFGRAFKMNGYTLSAVNTIVTKDSASQRESLNLSSLGPLSAMLVTGFTHTTARQTDGDGAPMQNNTVSFPQQLSLFIAGAISSKIGGFAQITYAAPDGSIGIDNVDVRFANKGKLGSKELLYGLTLNNNPTVQDPWNTVPAWGFPFMASGEAPTPGAATLIDGGLGQQVLGLGAYGMWNKLVYAEFSAYRSAQQGSSNPPGAASETVTRNFVPYWRLALQHQFSSDYLMLGTFGMVAELYPAGVTGPVDKYANIAGDLQWEHALGKGVLIGRGVYLHEKQTLDALVNQAEPGAQNLNNDLNTLRVNASWMPSYRYNFSLGYFNTDGSSDALLYPAAPMSGFSTGSPNSSGGLAEFDFNAWQNIRVGAQYVGYGRYNGASSNYDGSGRKASDNNTFYLFAWVAF